MTDAICHVCRRLAPACVCKDGPATLNVPIMTSENPQEQDALHRFNDTVNETPVPFGVLRHTLHLYRKERRSAVQRLGLLALTTSSYAGHLLAHQAHWGWVTLWFALSALSTLVWWAERDVEQKDLLSK